MLVVFLDYLEGHGAPEPTADRGRRRYTGGTAEVQMTPRVSHHIRAYEKGHLYTGSGGMGGGGWGGQTLLL